MSRLATATHLASSLQLDKAASRSGFPSKSPTRRIVRGEDTRPRKTKTRLLLEKSSSHVAVPELAGVRSVAFLVWVVQRPGDGLRQGQLPYEGRPLWRKASAAKERSNVERLQHLPCHYPRNPKKACF